MDKVRRLPTWKAGLMHKVGRLSLMKSTLSTIPIYTMISINVPAWAIKAVDKCRRGFFSTGTETARGGQCSLAWPIVTRPWELGGLGVPDLKLTGYALHLRWLWLKRVDQPRPWARLPLQCEPEVQRMFEASIDIKPGNGGMTLFWTDRWLDGTTIQALAPDLALAVPARTRQQRTLQQALINKQWIHDITGSLSVIGIVQYLHLWSAIQRV